MEDTESTIRFLGIPSNNIDDEASLIGVRVTHSPEEEPYVCFDINGYNRNRETGGADQVWECSVDMNMRHIRALYSFLTHVIAIDDEASS